MDAEILKKLLLTLLLLGFFGLKVISSPTMDYLYFGLLLLLVFPSLNNKNFYAKTILAYTLFVLISCIYSKVVNGQALFSVIGHSYEYFSLLFFFYLMGENMSSKDALKLLEVIALTFCILYIIQWLIYPTILFSSVERFASGEKYRARMPGSICGYFMLMYSINRYLLKKDWKYIIYGILGFIPIIIQGFRTLTALSALSAFLMIPFVLRSGRKTISYSILGCLVVALSFTTSLVQQKTTEMLNRQESNQNFENDNYIRYLSFYYYRDVQFTKPYEKIIGAGKPSDPSSEYYRQINAAKKNYHFFWTDLGLVGLSFVIGIPAVLLLVFLYLCCMWKSKEPQLQFIRFALFIPLVGSVTTAELYREGNILLLSFFLYIEYKYHQEQNTRSKSKKITIKNGIKSILNRE